MGKADSRGFRHLKKATKEKPLQDLEVEQLVHFSPEERQAIERLVERLPPPAMNPLRTTYTS